MKNKINIKKLFTTFVALLTICTASAQTAEYIEIKKSLDSLKKVTSNQSQEISKFENWRMNSWFKDIKLSGYAQIQWQMAETRGANALFAGGNFNEDTFNRFQIRRARLKVTYKRDYFSTAIQVGATSYDVSLIEANASFHLPNEIVTATAGIVYLPFSYYIEYSSSARFEPEMPRVIKSLLPSDTYLGVQTKLKGKRGTELNNLEYSLGTYSQNGHKPELYQRRKIISRIQYNKKYNSGLLWGVMGSAHYGGEINLSETSYTYSKSEKKYVENQLVKGDYNNAIYWDLGARFEFDSPAGRTRLYGEYLWGTQPSWENTNISPVTESELIATEDIYNRKFSGYYVTLEQQLPIKNLYVMARYDVYDGNREIKGNQIGLQTGTGVADLKFSTFGAGIAYEFIKGHFRITAFYEHIWNEKSINLPGYNKNIKDNILTIRFQAKF